MTLGPLHSKERQAISAAGARNDANSASVTNYDENAPRSTSHDVRR